MVKHLPYHPKVKGLSPAGAPSVGRDSMTLCKKLSCPYVSKKGPRAFERPYKGPINMNVHTEAKLFAISD
jgi:hypothetical protein